MHVIPMPIWLTVVFLILAGQIMAQAEDPADTVIVVNDLQQHNRYIEYRAELYQLGPENLLLDHRFLFQPLFNKKDVFTLEIGVAQSFVQSTEMTTPSDLNITYRRNFPPKEKKEIGYQGMAVIVKNIIPTGRSEYVSGFNNWSIEPAIGQQWTVQHPSFYVGYLVRYNYSYAAIPGNSRRFSFLRAELSVGFENEEFWLFATPDFRYIPDDDASSVLLSVDIGYKFNNTFGLQAELKPRLKGDYFYESLYLIGIYKYL